ncbi:MAG: tungsten ABC transporter substrate-binding protein [Alkaliphilus sp.]|nr:MAG: tungsten ABC transporter substrate-binding protein [Alkaliphilus sp.]
MRKNYKKVLGVVFVLVLSIGALIGCTQENPGSIILATTTSTENSGLLDYIIPVFEEKTGIEVKVVAVGTGKALQMGRDGEADVLLVHAKQREITFVEEGHGTERFEVMYNDFVIIGPKEDPANLLNNAKADTIAGFKLINEGEFEFVSRGDDSGTHTKEKNLWLEAGIEPSGDWYVSAGRGMGDVIQMADEKLTYTLTDRATFLALSDTIDLVVLLEGDSKLFNQYAIIPIDPSKNELVNHGGAMEFVNWILSDEAQKLIAGFGVEKFGEALFIPNAE